jgi:hypothetical protein
MSVEAVEPGGIALRLGEDRRGYGWVIFAGVMLTVGGTMNVIDGIGAISGSHFYARHATYMIGDLNSLGWAVLAIGVVQLLSGFGVLAKNQLARWVGVAAAAINGVVQLLLLPAYPLWSLALFAVDIAVMHGLLVYGARNVRAV